jgi:hypothetical protein
VPVRVRYKLSASVSSTPAEERDLGNIACEVVSDDVEDGGAWKTKLAAGAAAAQIPLDSIVSATVLILRTNAKDPNESPNGITLQINDPSGQIFTIQPVGYAREGHFLLTTSGITAIYLGNPGSVDMEVTILACGDSPL